MKKNNQPTKEGTGWLMTLENQPIGSSGEWEEFLLLGPGSQAPSYPHSSQGDEE